MRKTLAGFSLASTLVLSACTSVTPAIKDTSTRVGPCVDGGPDSVAQQFYDYRADHRNATDITGLRPYLSDSLWQLVQQQQSSTLKFSSFTPAPDSASVASASTIPNSDAQNIPLRVSIKQGTNKGKDEVLMVREGQCWVVDDVRYLTPSSTAVAGTLRQSLERH